MIEAGTVLQNRYRIDKKIGQGGMGAVFVATDERFGSVVAIKETFFTDEGYRRAFEREARLLNNLRHPALPRVSDHFTEESGQFLVMEYITGDDLSEKLEDTNSPFPLTDVLNWADQLLDALDFLHTQESPVIHRDIKPQNLKLTPRGQIILLDFGLAKGNPTDAKHQTAAQSVFGYSRNYASLEQIQGTGTDPRSDLYSLGATLYHLMTGIPPVDALTRAMTVLNGDEDPLPLADAVHPQVPASVAEVLSRAMALNANFRPTSAVAMRAMLNESEKVAADDFKTLSNKNSAAGLLTQKTEVFENLPKGRQTEQAAIATEVLPLAMSQNAPNKTQTELPRVSLFENGEQNSIETKLNTKGRDSQNSAHQNSATQILTTENTNQSKPQKRGKAIAATALGGFVLIGSALGGLYVLKPDVFGGNISNSNGTIEKKDGENEAVKSIESINTNTTNSNALANVPTNNNASVATSTKKTVPEKTTTETTTARTLTQGKGTLTETSGTNETSEVKKETKIVNQDEEGNRVYEDGTVKAKDGTVVYPNGKVTKNGVVIYNPRQNPQGRPVPPDIRRPPLTREQIENLPPEQRKKIIQIMKRRNQQMNQPDQPDQP